MVYVRDIDRHFAERFADIEARGGTVLVDPSGGRPS